MNPVRQFHTNTLIQLAALSGTNPVNVRQLVIDAKSGESYFKKEGDDYQTELEVGQYALQTAITVKGDKRKLALVLVGNKGQKDTDCKLQKEHIKALAMVLQQFGFDQLAGMHPIGGNITQIAYCVEFDGDGPRIIECEGNEVKDFTRVGDDVYALTEDGLVKLDSELLALDNTQVLVFAASGEQSKAFVASKVTSVSRAIPVTGGEELRVLNVQGSAPFAAMIADPSGDSDETPTKAFVIGGQLLLDDATTVFGPSGIDGDGNMVIALDKGGNYANQPLDEFLATAIPPKYQAHIA